MQMQSLNIHLDCETHPLPLDQLTHEGMITDIGLLSSGTMSGKPSIALVITLPNGHTVLGQTTWTLLKTAVDTLAASPIITG